MCFCGMLELFIYIPTSIPEKAYVTETVNLIIQRINSNKIKVTATDRRFLLAITHVNLIKLR